MMNWLTWLEGTGLGTWVREAPTAWAFPTVITLHTFGMALLAGASAVLDLRLLGFGRTMPLEPMRPLFRVMWVGLCLNVLTGCMLFAAFATADGTQVMFLVKMCCVAIGVATILLLRRRLYEAKVDAAVISGATKGLALLSLLAWVLAITSGKLLEYAKAY
jgi:hypothetical protein